MFRILFYRKVPKKNLSDLMEFTTRTNNGMWGGNFELDLDTGDLNIRPT